MKMFGTKAVVNSEYAQDFLNDCLETLRNNINSHEKFENRKHKTGFGPNREHFDRVLKKEIGKTDFAYWMEDGRIFQYHEQLKDIFYRYQYKMNSKGF